MTPPALKFILIGHPVGHSLSPAIHEAVYQQENLPHQYSVRDCPDADAVRKQVQALRAGKIAGANVTVPHKRLALQLADEVHESARATGAANVLMLQEGRVVAHNTDAPALGELLRDGVASASGSRSGDHAGSSALILGNGGAALAAVEACRLAGFQRICVSGRRWRPNQEEWPRAEEFESLGAEPVAWVSESLGEPAPDEAARRAQRVTSAADVAQQAEVVVQASSAGMLGVGQGDAVVEVLPWASIDRSCFLYDVVYNPAMTPFLRRARQEGLAHEGGLSMLVGQAALAVELWLGIRTDRTRMREAAEVALFGAPQAKEQA